VLPADSAIPQPPIRCAIYTRKSTEEGLTQEFNSLDAQREGDVVGLVLFINGTLGIEAE